MNLHFLPVTVFTFALMLTSKGAAADPSFEPQTVDAAIAIGYGLAIGDMDGDGKQDILLADAKEFVWYKNPTWEKQVFAKLPGIRDNVCIAAEDIDGDGKVDVAVGANWNPGETVDEAKSGSVHYLTRPTEAGKLWGVVDLPHEPTVHRMRWIQTDDKRWALVVLMGATWTVTFIVTAATGYDHPDKRAIIEVRAGGIDETRLGDRLDKFLRVYSHGLFQERPDIGSGLPHDHVG